MGGRLVALWLVPLVGLGYTALRWPDRASWLLGGLLMAVVALYVWGAVAEDAWHSFEDDHGPVRAIVSFAFAGVLAVLSLKQPLRAAAMLVALGSTSSAPASDQQRRLMALDDGHSGRSRQGARRRRRCRGASCARGAGSGCLQARAPPGSRISRAEASDRPLTRSLTSMARTGNFLRSPGAATHVLTHARPSDQPRATRYMLAGSPSGRTCSMPARFPEGKPASVYLVDRGWWSMRS